MMRGVPDCTVLYPCDARQRRAAGRARRGDARARLHPHVAAEDARHLRAKETFHVGGSKTLRQSADDAVTVVAAGVTVFEALKAADTLKAEGIAIRVIDAYSVQPIDRDGLVAAGRATDGRLITVEDHYAHGGLGDAVSEAVWDEGFRVRRLAVREIPRSGTPDELLDRYGIIAARDRRRRARDSSAKHIAAAPRR